MCRVKCVYNIYVGSTCVASRVEMLAMKVGILLEQQQHHPRFSSFQARALPPASTNAWADIDGTLLSSTRPACFHFQS